ncbi:outer membrane beta-barrel protein [Pedobacter frigoris]|uniref:outer membrane beta-barrel protein n=1 Tax=Pedobacter frigoris TaxID=2571272 RepID=UPI00292D6B6B|nr:outer membrane beta-barrel protein [Pedobacter frigoris]
MELNDKEFDTTFREKVFDAEPQFEEAAWDKMEQKLRRRDRVVLFRKITLVCLIFFVSLAGYFALKIPSASSVKNDAVQNAIAKNTKTTAKQTNKGLITARQSANKFKEVRKEIFSIKKTSLGLDTAPGFKTTEQSKSLAFVNQVYIEPNLPQNVKVALTPVITTLAVNNTSENTIRYKRTIPMNLAISAGPEFNSASSLVGGQPGFTAGLTFGVGITKRLNLQTGLRYSIKDYYTNNYAYKFNSQRIQNLISSVDASCAVLEIPVIASYKIADHRNGSLHLNTGISSYLMLKEDYVFKYTPQSGIKDRLVNKRNENQHFLSVLDLSATYFIRLKSSNLKAGIEPFVKVPLTGVGEGKVNLKSSGISLKLSYDLDKKNN